MASTLPPLGVYKGMVPCARSHSSDVLWPVRLFHISRSHSGGKSLRQGEAAGNSARIAVRLS